MLRSWHLVAVLLTLGSFTPVRARAAPAVDPDVEGRAKVIERLLTAPCCYKGTLEDHASAVATQMRQEIRAHLRAGKTKGQILSYYRAKYGQAVLVEPPQGGLSGFILYGIPFGLAVIGLVVMTAFMARRRREDPGDGDAHGKEAASLPPVMEARIDALVAGEEPAPR